MTFLILSEATSPYYCIGFDLKKYGMIFIRTVVSFLKDKKYRDLLVTSSIIVAFGSIVYHNVEGWSWIDSIYFSVITLTTIGYGDFSPVTDAGKVFTIFYIVIGLGMILTFINAVYYHYNQMKIMKNGQ